MTKCMSYVRKIFNSETFVKAEMQLRGFGVDAIVTRKKPCDNVDNVIESHHGLRF